MKYVLFFIVVAAASTASAQPLELKGLRVGMSEADFKRANPRAECEKAYRAPVLEKAKPALPSLRTCNVPGYTLANVATTRNQFLFYDGRLGRMFHTFHADDMRALQAAFAAKFGQPQADINSNAMQWNFDADTALRLRPVAADATYLFLESGLSAAYDSSVKSLTTQQAQGDL